MNRPKDEIEPEAKAPLEIMVPAALDRDTQRGDLPRGSVLAMQSWRETSTPMTLTPGAAQAGYGRSGKPRRRIATVDRMYVARSGSYGVFLFLGELPRHVELTKDRAARMIRQIQVAGAPERIAREADEEAAAAQGAEVARMAFERRLAGAGDRVHELKSWPQYFSAVVAGVKKFELRRDDRGGFVLGDLLYLREWASVEVDIFGKVGEYTGREAVVRVTYVMNGDAAGIAEGYALLGVELLGSRLGEGEHSPAGELPQEGGEP